MIGWLYYSDGKPVYRLGFHWEAPWMGHFVSKAQESVDLSQPVVEGDVIEVSHQHYVVMACDGKDVLLQAVI